MEIISSRLRADDDLAARLSPIFSRVSAGQDFELSDSIEDWPVRRLIGGLVIIVDAVFDVVVCHLAVPGYVKAASEPKRRTLSRCKHIRLELSELEVVSSIQGKFFHLLLIDDITHHCVFGLHQKGAGGNGDALFHLTD